MKFKSFLRYWIQTIIFFSFFQYGLFELHNIIYLNFIDDILILLLFIYLFSFGRKHSIIQIKKSKYDFIFLILFFIAIISAFLNQIPLSNLLLGMKGYFLYIPFFYSIYWINFSPEDKKKIIDFALKLFVIELFVCLYQLVHAYFSNNLGPDVIYGTFNGANKFGYVIFILLYFSLYNYYFNSDKKYLKYVVILSPLLILSSSRIAILLFPIIFIILNLKNIIRKLSIKKIFFGLIFIFLLFILLNQPFIQGSRTKIVDFYKISTLKTHFTDTEYKVTSGSARNLWYPLTIKLIEKYSFSPFIGFGPGMYASYAAFRLMPNTNLRIYDYFNQIELGLDPEVDSQIIPIMGELGYFGITGFFILFFYMLYRALKINKCTKKSEFTKVLSSTSSAYCIFYIFAFYISQVLESQTTSVLLFLFIGLTENDYLHKKVKNNVIN